MVTCFKNSRKKERKKEREEGRKDGADLSLRGKMSQGRCGFTSFRDVGTDAERFL